MNLARAGLKWRTCLVVLPLALLVVLAIATSGVISSGAAVYCEYGGCAEHMSPSTSYGISDQMLYVANGRDSSTAIIDVGTMSIVDTVAAPPQPTPAWLNSWNPGLMNWEIHGAVPSQDRQSIYMVGALSGGSYDPATGDYRLADYRMYQVDVATDAVMREIPLTGGPGAPVNPVGFCGLEYNLNNEASTEIVAANMNISNETGMMALHDPTTGDPIDLDSVRGSGASEHGGWAYEDISAGPGANTGNLDVNQNATDESSTCGIAWSDYDSEAGYYHGFASQQFEPLTDKVNWSSPGLNNGTGTVAGEIAPFAGASLQHQAASDKANDRLFVTDSDGNVYVYAMSTGAEVGAINIRALTDTPANNIHGVEVAPGNSNVLYVTSRETPDPLSNAEVVVDITSLVAPSLIGYVDGLATGACGVYAIDDKSEYYTAANPTGLGNEMLFVANGRASNTAVIDVGTMSIVDTVEAPDQPTPAWLNSWNPGLMNWEIHGAVPGADTGFGRINLYQVGALSGGSYDPVTGDYRLADYRMYDVNTATDAVNREIPLTGGPGAPVNPVGFCGLEYNLNNEASTEIVAANMNISNETGMMALHDPTTGDPIDLSGVRGSGASEHGGWAYEDISAGPGANTGNLDVNQNATDESSTCGIAWSDYDSEAGYYHGFASQQFEPLTDKVNWSSPGLNNGTGTVAGEIAPFAGASLQHQAASDKARDRLYVTDSDGNVYVYAMSTGAEVAAINMRGLTGTLDNNIHGVEVSPGNPDVLYVTSRETPDLTHNMEVVVDITSLTAPTVIGSVNGLATGTCGVYAIADKSEYYGTKPALSLTLTSRTWGTYANYLVGLLTVNYSVGNTGTAGAANVAIVGSSSTNGVLMATTLPASVGNIAGGGSTALSLQYTVPGGTVFFRTTSYATAQNGAQVFTYPGPYTG